jgi:hypothetical protein
LDSFDFSRTVKKIVHTGKTGGDIVGPQRNVSKKGENEVEKSREILSHLSLTLFEQ